MGSKLKKGEVAHHIVPSTHSYAAADKARKILEKFKIGINEADNGLGLLPKDHFGLHTHEYMDKVLELLEDAAKTGKRSEVIDMLKIIGNQIKHKNF